MLKFILHHPKTKKMRKIFLDSTKTEIVWKNITTFFKKHI